MNAKLNSQFIGIDFNFSQYIQDNIEEAVSGVKGENSVKLFGPDLGELERISKSLKTELAKVPGVVNPAAFNLLGQPNLNVRIDRAKAARYGFSVGDINTIVQAAIGGQEVTRVYEGEINSALTVRLAARYRDNVDAIRSIPIALAEQRSEGHARLYRAERRRRRAAGNRRRLYLSREQPALHSAEIQRARARSRLDRRRGAGARRQERAAAAGLPHGVVGRVRRVAGGQEAARGHRAAQPDPDPGAALRLFNSVRDSLIALSGIPFAVAGGILGLYVAGLNLSVSAAVGFISLFGVAAMDGILLVSYIRRDLEEGMGTETAIIQAGEARMRQVFMTGLSACIGLVPAAISTGIGSQVQQPLACVIVGGMLLSPICSLLVIPTVARLFMPNVAGTDGRRRPRPSRSRPNAKPKRSSACPARTRSSAPSWRRCPSAPARPWAGSARRRARDRGRSRGSWWRRSARDSTCRCRTAPGCGRACASRDRGRRRTSTA